MAKLYADRSHQVMPVFETRADPIRSLQRHLVGVPPYLLHRIPAFELNLTAAQRGAPHGRTLGRRLTLFHLSNNFSDMKVTSRDFQRDFARRKLRAKAGETSIVTSGNEEFVFQAVQTKTWQGALKGKGKIVGDLVQPSIDSVSKPPAACCMRLRILNDLHLEFGPFECPAVDEEVDAVVLAGDIQPGLKGLRWIQKNFPETPVIYVAGNHEFYAKVHPRLLDELREAARGTHVHFLENDAVTIGDTVFWGATLWSDFGLNQHPARSAEIAGEEVTDYRKIYRDPSENFIRPADTLELHRRSMVALKRHLDEVPSAKRVIVTHHAPTRHSLPPGMLGQPHAPSYASALEELVARSGAKLWVHGHIHAVSDYPIANTRVVCNPRGYVFQDVPGFNPRWIIEI